MRMTMQSSEMHDTPRRRLLRSGSVDVPSPPPHTLKKRLSRTDSSTMVLTADPFKYSFNFSSNVQSRVAGRGVLTRSSTITTGMMLPNCRVMTPPIKVECPPRRLVKQKTFSSPQYKQPVTIPQPEEAGDPSLSTSCPNLAEEEKVQPQPYKTPVRHSKSSDGRLGGSQFKNAQQQANPRLLTVPNIFTTSQTRSSSDPGTVVHRTYRHSAPELAAAAKLTDLHCQVQPKCSLAKSLSESPRRLSQSQESLASDMSVDPTKPRFAKVLDYLYIGNNEAVDNERLMCRLGISSIINLTDGRPVQHQETGSSFHSRWPCPCGSDTRHLKATLRLQVSDTDTAEFESYTEQINKFIEGARRANKKVLVQCVTGHSLSVVAVMQYLMAFRGMNLRKAYSLVMKTMSDLYIPPMYKDLLQRQEKMLLSPDEQSLCFDSSNASSPLPMEAWTSAPTPPCSPSHYM